MLAIVSVVSTAAGLTRAETAEPAQEAHDTYCIVCHDTSIYTRADRLAKDYDALRGKVNRWQGNVPFNWSDAEIDRMASWLARRYFRMGCPQC